MKRDGHPKNIYAIILTCIVVVLFFTILFIVLKMNGRETISGEFNKTEKDDSLTCTGVDIPYQFYDVTNYEKSNTSITFIFDKNHISSIALTQSLTFNTPELASASISRNHASMNISFGKSGLSADSLSATYNINQNTAEMRLYAKSKELNDRSSKYFLADNLDESVTSSDIIEVYKEKGIICKQS